jgi:beta-N-acetylhexosaminidase
MRAAVMRDAAAVLLLALTASGTWAASSPARPASAPGAASRPRGADEKQAAAWARQALRKLSLDERIAQLVVPGLNGVFTPIDSEAGERLERLVREGRVGGFHVFGGTEALPPVLLNAVYGTTGARAVKGDALAIASLLNRLQRASALPLLFTADFEGGSGYIVEGGTRLPRAMALGATRDEGLAERAGLLAAGEGRALGIHVDFYPVVDVNVNPRNPVIGIRSFGEDPQLVARMAAAYMRGIRQGGMLATAKHFPGHGDTEVDTHLDLATVEHGRERLDAVELVPFRALIGAGVDAVMSSHIRLPALDPTEGLPATLSRPVLTGLLRGELGFEGIVFTDSMSMHAISRRFTPDRAAALAVQAGADVVLDSPDPDAALRGIREAVARGEIPREQIDRSAERLLRAKARLGLHRLRTVELERVPAELGGRAREAVATEIAARAVTLLKDERGQFPLRLGREARLLLLTLVDHADGWREGAPGRVLVPELRERFPSLTAVEVTDRTTAAELDLLRTLARTADAVVAALFTRAADPSGRLPPPQQALLESLARGPAARPFLVVALGSPFVGEVGAKLPALAVSYELGDAPEGALVRALCGEANVAGRLPVALPGLFAAGHGLDRAALAPGGPIAAR